MSDDDKTRKVESTEKFMLTLESITNLRYNNELKLSTDELNQCVLMLYPRYLLRSYFTFFLHFPLFSIC